MAAVGDIEKFRAARRHSCRSSSDSEQRSEYERDRDRLLYSAYFRRLAHITQVVGPNEGYAFHNRLTHVLKVAQVGRRLSERLLELHGDKVGPLGGLDPSVVEAAALAHDLGHPPFGHLAEKELNRLATNAGLADGFEGNAQSFRVICELEIRDQLPEKPGLNLTRATLNATLKYPWQRDTPGVSKSKWGAYETELKDFKFARDGLGISTTQCLEAQFMDWADDIAYSVHDMEDFYRAGRIPLDRLTNSTDEQADFLKGVFTRLQISDLTKRREYEQVIQDLLRLFPSEPYAGRRDQKAMLRTIASHEISKFEEATSIATDGLVIDPQVRIEVNILKQLVWHYVIENPMLATQQHGQRRVIRELFEIYETALANGDLNIFPALVRSELQSNPTPKRLIVDLIASYTEKQAIELHQRLTGAVSGPAFGMSS